VTRRSAAGCDGLAARVPLLFLALVALVVVAGCASAPTARVEIAIRYSHFNPSRISVPHGTSVTFVLVNDDPIDHEWIVGTDELHRGHRTGTEPHHASRPTEVTIPALGRRITTVTFPAPGVFSYICHLPGHEAYGMVGTLEVS
jgi:plastocyanin